MEMVISFIVMGVILAGILETINSIRDISNRSALGSQQTEWRKVVHDLQDKYYTQLVSENVTKITLGTSTVAVTIKSNLGTGNKCDIKLPQMQKLLNDLGFDDSLLFDPWGGRWCLLAAPSNYVREVEGYSVNIKNIGVYSEGKKKGFQNPTITLTNGTCGKIEKDDTALLCNNGVTLVAEKIKDSLEKIEALHDKLYVYSKTKIKNEPDSDNRNYFFTTTAEINTSAAATVTVYSPATCSPASLRITGTTAIQAAARANTDIKSSVAMFYDTECAGTAISGARLESIKNIIGISAQDVTDGFGNTLVFDNSSPQVRNPFHHNEKHEQKSL